MIVLGGDFGLLKYWVELMGLRVSGGGGFNYSIDIYAASMRTNVSSVCKIQNPPSSSGGMNVRWEIFV